MQFRFFGNASHAQHARELVEQQAQLLDRRFATTDEALKSLDVTLVHHPKTDSFRAKLAFHAPGRIIAADGHARLLPTAIRRAFDDLNGEVDGFLAHLQSQPDIRREQLLVRAQEDEDPLGPALSGMGSRSEPAEAPPTPPTGPDAAA